MIVYISWPYYELRGCGWKFFQSIRTSHFIFRWLLSVVNFANGVTKSPDREQSFTWKYGKNNIFWYSAHVISHIPMYVSGCPAVCSDVPFFKFAYTSNGWFVFNFIGAIFHYSWWLILCGRNFYIWSISEASGKIFKPRCKRGELWVYLSICRFAYLWHHSYQSLQRSQSGFYII